MDHEWGRNITEMGLGDLGATITARYTGPGGVDRWLLNTKLPTQRWFAQLSVFEPTRWIIGIAASGGPFGSFPYGYAVDPDGPV